MNNKGVTLFELLVVIVIIGIISMISIPSMAVVYSNTQKDTVLNTAINIERAAKNYCQQDNYLSCSPGEKLGYDKLSPYMISVDFDDSKDTLQVTVTGGLRHFFIVYAKEDSYSFPYTQTGHLVFSIINGEHYPGAVATTSNRDYVNIPIEHNKLEIPPWVPNTFAVGDVFKYDDKFWQVRYDGSSSTPPYESALSPYGPYQEITIYYREYNTYLTGDSVVHSGKTFVAMNDDMSGIEPGTAFFWQEQTHYYRHFNIYSTGNIVTHIVTRNNAQYQAQYQALNYNMSGIEPGSTWGWQEMTDEWRYYNTYKLGDEINHEVGGIVIRYVARGDSQGKEPESHTSYWEVISDSDLWSLYRNYPQGTIVTYGDKLFQAREDASPGQVPGDKLSPWQELTDEWKDFNVYVSGDIVLYGEQSYVAQGLNQGVTPGTDSAIWVLL